MKMIIVIVKDQEADAVARALTTAEYRVTRVASTGGFLRSGMATLLVGVDDAQLDSVITLIRGTLPAAEPREKRGMLFVVPILQYEQV